MSGIVFFRTDAHDEVIDFYTSLGAEVWLEQSGCTILNHGNLLFGFCEADEDREAEDCGVITFYYDTRDEVDEMYRQVEERAWEEPVQNDEYEIYQFFADDPEGRTVEFQTFLHELQPIGMD